MDYSKIVELCPVDEAESKVINDPEVKRVFRSAIANVDHSEEALCEQKFKTQIKGLQMIKILDTLRPAGKKPGLTLYKK